MKQQTTWIVVSDGARARIFVNEGRGTGLRPAFANDFMADHRPSHELGGREPGRGKASADGPRHGIEPTSDAHDQLKVEFARDMARVIEDGMGRQAFDSLVLVAPPRMLGNLRAELPKAVIKRVSAQLDKDLTQVPIHALPCHLEAVVTL